MADLPSGTVTFLFTDIQGSTRLWERDSEAMWRAVTRHNEILDTVIAAHGGHHFKTIGDAYQAAFPDAASALATAVTAQQALNSEAWPETGPIRVRMALHAGAAHPVEGDYLAPCLNRLSRLLSTGYGGQVLVSHTVQQLTRGHLPPAVALHSLGLHRLRDLLEPEHVFQTIIPGLPAEFPPLKSLERHPTNLPIQPNPLVGREAELGDIAGLMTRNDVRLVTLTGAGGTGKTRLAMQAAAELLDAFEDGAFFVDLAPLADPDFVLPTLAATLGVREVGTLSLRDSLIDYLANKRLLLVLDNFEHVVDAATVVADLLATCVDLAVLVTSRAPLRLRGEREYPVQPLSLPDPKHLPPIDELATVDAVELFVQRAIAARPDFELRDNNAADVAAICVRLDGLPLAIELAAARVKLLEPAALLDRLSRRLNVLTGGSRDLPTRQRTLRSTIAWSYGLLHPAEQALYRRLAVFAGSGSITSAEVIATAAGALDLDVLDGVTALVDQSLVRRAPSTGGETRFTMLDTLREFGLDQMEASEEADATRRAHAAWYLRLAEEAEPHLMGPEQVRWLDRLDTEHENLRAAIEWSLTGGGQDTGLRLAGTLWRFWHLRGYIGEGRSLLDRVLANDEAPVGAARAKAVHGAGALALLQADYQQASTFNEESLALARELDNVPGAANALNNLGNVALAQNDLGRAMVFHEESLTLRRTLGDTQGVAASLNNLGLIALERGDFDEAVALHEESLALRRALGNKQGAATTLNNLGNVALVQGNFERAAAYYEESLTLKREMGDAYGVAGSLNNLGVVVREQGDYGRAVALYDESLTLARNLGDREGVANALNNLGIVACKQGDYMRSATVLEESLALYHQLGALVGMALVFQSVADLAEEVGQPALAVRFFAAADAIQASIVSALPPVKASEHRQHLKELRERLGEATYSAAWATGQELNVEEAITGAVTFLHTLHS